MGVGYCSEGGGYGRGRVVFVGVELAREWSWVGWTYGRYGGWGFWVCGESGVRRAVLMRSGVGGEDLVLYGDKWSSAVWVHPQLSLHYPNTRQVPPTQPTPTPNSTPQPIYPTTAIHHSPNPYIQYKNAMPYKSLIIT